MTFFENTILRLALSINLEINVVPSGAGQFLLRDSTFLLKTDSF